MEFYQCILKFFELQKDSVGCETAKTKVIHYGVFHNVTLRKRISYAFHNSLIILLFDYEI